MPRGVEDVQLEVLPIEGEAYKLNPDGTIANPPSEPCCSGTNCIMCAFGCATCCCLRNFICKKMVFAPPSPPFYYFKDNAMYRIPLTLYNEDVEFDKQQFELVENKRLEIKCFKIKTRKRKEVASVFIQHPQAKATILFSHGNAADIGIMSFHFELMAETLKVNVYGYDYTGYGESTKPGHPTPGDVYADAEAVFKHITEDLKIPPSQLIIYGQSLGSGPSLHLAKLHPVCGVVIHSGLMSAVRVINPYLVRTPWYDVFPNIDSVKECQSPVMVIHGKQDQIIHVYHGIRLFKCAPLTIKPWFVKGGDHNEIEIRFEQEYFDRLKWAIDDFLDIYKSKPPPESKAGGRKKPANPIVLQPGESSTRPAIEEISSNNKSIGSPGASGRPLNVGGSPTRNFQFEENEQEPMVEDVGNTGTATIPRNRSSNSQDTLSRRAEKEALV